MIDSIACVYDLEYVRLESMSKSCYSFIASSSKFPRDFSILSAFIILVFLD